MENAPGRLSLKTGLAAGCAVLLCLACDSAPEGPLLDLPLRPNDAVGGAQVAREIGPLEFDAREARIYREIASGNVPTWLRQFQRVDLVGETNGQEHDVTFWALPDYLAIGSDTDFFLIPMSPQVAQRIADLVGGSLPTPRMVDAIWASAKIRIAPIRIQPSELMTSVRYFVRHDGLVRGQRQLFDATPGTFVAGHKKDVVLSPRLSENPGKVAIYGWHGLDGEPLQPLHVGLDETWVGYNHGVRLVHRSILIDGAERDLVEVLSTPGSAALLTSDRVIPDARYPIQRENH